MTASFERWVASEGEDLPARRRGVVALAAGARPSTTSDEQGRALELDAAARCRDGGRLLIGGIATAPACG